MVGYFSIKYAQSKSYQRFWYWAQLIQVLTINAWYILTYMPLTDNLPFIIVAWLCLRSLFAPRGTYIKQYFALLGVLGSIAALVYPPLTLPIPPYYCTQPDFLVTGPCLPIVWIYLQDFYQSEKQDNLRIVKITFGMNAVIFWSIF